MKKIIIPIMLLISVSALPQKKSKFLYADFAAREAAIDFIPSFSNISNGEITFGGGIDYRQWDEITLFQTLQLSGYSILSTSTAVSLTTSLGLRFGILPGFYGEASAGLGTIISMSGNFSSSSFSAFKNAEIPIDLRLGYAWDEFSTYLKFKLSIVSALSHFGYMPFYSLGIGFRYIIPGSD